jgi:hypothetical protein
LMHPDMLSNAVEARRVRFIFLECAPVQQVPERLL